MISTMRDKQKLGIYYSIELFMVDSQRTVVVFLLILNGYRAESGVGSVGGWS